MLSTSRQHLTHTMLDLDNMPLLIGPRRKRMLAERDDREKLARIHMRRAKGPKNHATNRERSHYARKKAAIAKRIIAATADAVVEYKTQVRAYWLGERDDHP